MSVIITRPKRGARRAPQGRPAINRGSTQARGLVHWFPLVGEQRARDVVTGQRIDSIVSVPPFAATRIGMAADFVGGYYRDQGSFSPKEINWSAGVTMSVWCYPRTFPGNQFLLTLGDGGTSQRAFLLLLGTAVVRGQIIGNGQNEFFDSGSAIASNEWVHIVVTFQESSPYARQAYINGEVSGTSNNNAVDATPSGINGIAIGGLQHSTSGQFDGRMKDVRIYNRVLKEPEIRALYAPRTRWDLWRQPDQIFYAPAPPVAVVEEEAGGKGGLSLSAKRMRELERLQMLQRDDDEIMTLLARWLR